MSLLDGTIVSGIVLFLILLVWSRVMDQTMLDTFNEIKAMILGVFSGGEK